jgi:3-oxoacyl-[acyl-carrier-protein] synthase-3
VTRARDRWAKLPSTGAKLAAVAHHLPVRVMTNQAIIDAHGLRLRDGWVRENVGIVERRWAQSDEYASALAVEVCQTLVERGGVAPADVSRLILATVSPDVMTPSTACIVQSSFAPGATFPCVDLVAACGGFLYALDFARRCVQTGDERVLCIASEVRSAYLDKSDRRTVMLFGDGAGGALVTRCAPGEVGIVWTETFADGRFWEAVSVTGSGTRGLHPNVPSSAPAIIMRDAGVIFERAVSEMAGLVERTAARFGIAAAAIDFFVFHQASAAIVHAVCERLGIPSERTIVNFDRVGNTTAASVPIALSEAAAAGRIASGDLVCLVATGGGFTAGVALLRWESDEADTAEQRGGEG